MVAARDFYEKHGGKAIIFARFVPIVRTFAPTVAGVAGMDYTKFAFYNIFGGLLWIWSLLLGGYYLGKVVPNIDKYIHVIVIAVLIISVIPIVIKWLKSRSQTNTIQS